MQQTAGYRPRRTSCILRVSTVDYYLRAPQVFYCWAV